MKVKIPPYFIMKKNNNTEIDLTKSLILQKGNLAVFRKIPVNKQGFVLLELPKDLQETVLNKLGDEEIIKLIGYLDPSSSVSLLRVIYKKPRRNKIIDELKIEVKNKVEFLLKFNPRTAAGLMNLHYIQVDKSCKIKDVLKLVKDYESKTKKFPEILVVKDGFLLGELEARSLFVDPNKKIERYIKKIPSVKYNKSETETIDLFKKNPHDQIVVLDEDESILGIIYSDDILELIGRESLRDLSSFAGVSKEENAFDSPLTKVKNRYRWLILNLATAFLAASVVSLFTETISAFVLLAVYMPIVAGMGGNAGSQALAVMVRGITLREIELKTAKKVIINEMLAGAVNGLIVGTIVAIISTIFNKNSLLGLIVGIAMVNNLIIAGLFGSFIPLLMKKLGKDPASSAAVFITTATDVFGFFVFLGLATLLL